MFFKKSLKMIKQISEFRGVLENPSECKAIKRGFTVELTYKGKTSTYSINALSSFNNMKDGEEIPCEDIVFNLLEDAKGKIVPTVL